MICHIKINYWEDSEDYDEECNDIMCKDCAKMKTIHICEIDCDIEDDEHYCHLFEKRNKGIK